MADPTLVQIQQKNRIYNWTVQYPGQTAQHGSSATFSDAWAKVKAIVDGQHSGNVVYIGGRLDAVAGPV